MDVLVIGTSLTNLLVATALSSHKKVLVIDENQFYGGSNACLPLPFTALPEPFKLISVDILDEVQLGALRDYHIELSPRLLYAHSSLLDIVRDTRINDYVQFKALPNFYLWTVNGLAKVPSSKESIFTDEDMALITKRRLMKFIKFAMEYTSDPIFEENKSNSVTSLMRTVFKLDDKEINALTYAISLSDDDSAMVLTAIPAFHRHLKSLGLYGTFPVIIPMYGAGAELVQALSRKAAVKGATFMLGKKLSPLSSQGTSVLAEDGESFEADWIVREGPRTADSSITRTTIVFEGNFSHLTGLGDGAVISFAPEGDFAFHCQLHGPGTGSCPPDRWIAYIWSKALYDATVFKVMEERISKLSKKEPSVLMRLTYVEPSCSLAQLEKLQTSGVGDYESMVEEAKTIYSKIMGNEEGFMLREDEDFDVDS